MRPLFFLLLVLFKLSLSADIYCPKYKSPLEIGGRDGIVGDTEFRCVAYIVNLNEKGNRDYISTFFLGYTASLDFHGEGDQRPLLLNFNK